MALEAYLQTLKIMHQALRCSWFDVRVCPSPNWHRREWYHVGQQVYRCRICERIAV